jgi:streptomycin 6-kinase
VGFFIPEALGERATNLFGEEGTRWLATLPARLSELQRDWSLRLGEPFVSGCTASWVAPVQLADGSEAVLKINFPERDALCEADALRVIEGRGAVRLLRASADGLSLLMERCRPGVDLCSVSVREGNEIGAGILRRLWQEVPPDAPFDPLSYLVKEWCEKLPHEGPAAGYDPALVDAAVELARELVVSAPRSVLLHGDFHPSNVLSAVRVPWLAIDPKPLVGDPAYDLAQWLGNRYEEAEQSRDPVAEMRRQTEQMSKLLDLDPARVSGWLFVKSLGWEWGPAIARVLHEVMGG